MISNLKTIVANFRNIPLSCADQAHVMNDYDKNEIKTHRKFILFTTKLASEAKEKKLSS